MAPTARTYLRCRLGVLITGAAVLTTLMTVTAAASTPAMKPPASGLTRPRTVVPGFLLDRGRYTSFDAPGGVVTWARDLNNRGQIAGFTLASTEADPLAGARGFLLAKGVKGPFTPIDVPGAPRNLVFGLNDHGQLVGSYENLDSDG